MYTMLLLNDYRKFDKIDKFQNYVLHIIKQLISKYISDTV